MMGSEGTLSCPSTCSGGTATTNALARNDVPGKVRSQTDKTVGGQPGGGGTCELFMLT